MSSSKVQTSTSTGTSDASSSSMAARLAISWAVVGVPLAYGIYETVKKTAALFTG